MVVILRTDNYLLAQKFADELKKSIPNVVLAADNDNHMFVISVEEQYVEYSKTIVRNVAKSITKDFTILNGNNSDEWENNKLSQAPDNYGVSTKNLISNFMNSCRNLGLVTISVVIICILFYLLDLFGFMKELFGIFSMVGFSIGEPETWYKIVTPVFMHGGIAHISFNLVMWIYAGSKIEKYMSKTYLVMVFIVGSVIPNFIQYVFYGPMFCGLSGVVYALIGFAWTVTFFGNSSRYASLGMPPGIMAISAFWILLGFMIPSFSMANGAHLGGILIGILFGIYELKFIKSKITM